MLTGEGSHRGGKCSQSNIHRVGMVTLAISRDRINMVTLAVRDRVNVRIRIVKNKMAWF